MRKLTKDVIVAIKMALEMMDKEYCTLSQIDYSEIQADGSFKKHLSEEKYLERPFAYEFYHQIRKLMAHGDVDFGEPIIQAEVDKRYQHCFKNGKIPDFIIHLPNSKQNLAVIEFKLATNLSRFKSDLEKLIEFKTDELLKYNYGVEVIIGTSESLANAKELVKKLNKSEGEEIVIIDFNTNLWKATCSSLKF